MTDTMCRLLTLCMDIDRAAAEVYKRLAASEPEARLRACWERMREEEEQHVKYWSRLARMAEEGIVPSLFENPEKVVGELEEVARDVARFVSGAGEPADARARARLALSMEFYLLEPAFETLLHFLRAFERESPKDRYSEHLDSLLLALAEYTRGEPELELIAKTTRRLWQRNRELLAAAQTDALTGLHNYRGFWTAVLPLASLAQRRHERVAVLTLDMDDFRTINDTLGHGAGDEALRSIADALRNTLRDADVVCRMSGDDFVAFLTGVDDAGLEAVLRRINDAVAERVVRGRKLAVSVGAAEAQLEGDVTLAVEHLMHRSEEDMRAARQRKLPQETASA